ncbi:MAG TPA: GNAT family N-acetyltransferase [Ramlibacter sp.]|jgi:predicted acetyltransferase|nr:GNAT family N-acetyltransferase [Ramlibacter sp.]
MHLVRPAREYLPAYVEALERGWSPNNERPEAAAREELASIAADPAAFLAAIDNPAGGGPPVTLPDGSTVPRLPGIRRWMWEDGFIGNIGLRWQHGTPELPPYCLGHIGYSVVPWAQGRGHATAALRVMLQEARRLRLPYVEITTDPDNLASQRVIAKAGGILHERFTKPAAFGSRPCLRYRVQLDD